MLRLLLALTLPVPLILVLGRLHDKVRLNAEYEGEGGVISLSGYVVNDCHGHLQFHPPQ